MGALVACAQGDGSFQASGAIHSGGDDPAETEDAAHEPKTDTRRDTAHDAPLGDVTKDAPPDAVESTDTRADDSMSMDAAAVDGGVDSKVDSGAAPTADSGADSSVDSGADSGVDSGPDSGADSAFDAARDGGADGATPLAATWGSTAQVHRCLVGSSFLYACPAGGPLGRAWGTGAYTDDSSICTAAVHAGKLDMIAGGVITLEMQAGAASYLGSTAFGVTTSDYGAWTCSFAVK